MDTSLQTKILELKRPDGGWVVNADGVRYDEGVAPLSDQEWADGEVAVAYLAYREARKPFYPSLIEFADAFVHQQNGDPTPMAAYVAKCNAVKQSFPKPK